MTISVNISLIHRADMKQYNAGEFHAAFDAVTVHAANGAHVCLFLPEGTGKSVVDAIRAAIAAPALHAEAAE
jgi:hypothetical protein